MTYKSMIKSGVAAIILAAACSAPAFAAPAQSVGEQNTRTIVLSIGRSQQIDLPVNITDVIVSDPNIANVEVKSPRRMYVFAKSRGEVTVQATDASGRTVYRVIVRVGNNIDSVSNLLLLAMPEANLQATTMNGFVLLTGTVDQPEDAAEAERLVLAFVNPPGESNREAIQVISRIKVATPLQVNLHVRIAEVSRSLSKEIATNLQPFKQGLDSNGQPYTVGVTRGRDFISNNGTLLFNEGNNTLFTLGRLFGLDFAAAFDMSERAGLVSTLANPNLTTVSGETAEFLAGGSFPIVTSSNNGTSVEYRNYGVGLTYTPTVLSDGRISLRVRSNVSDISSQGAVRIGGFEIPATTERMAETTVELGSGQSMMIAGLLSNQLGSSVEKIPGAGDIPILGALFKSNGWRRNETELMIVITPYLVKPVSDSQIVLPTDGIHTPHDLERVLLGTQTVDKGDKSRPMPKIAPDAPNGPNMGSVSQPAPALAQNSAAPEKAAGPGFSFND